MKRAYYTIAVVLAAMAFCVIWYAYRWQDVLRPATYISPYEVAEPADTLSVLFIGDSWAELHHRDGFDTVIHRMLEKELNEPLKVTAKGRGGATSKAIYRLMFQQTAGVDSAYCTEPLLRAGADYCVVIAGINDAARNLGPNNYCRNYELILRTLLDWHMKPVVIEVPDVDIYHLYSEKPFKDGLVDKVQAWLNNTKLYDVTDYRKQLKARLEQTGMMDSVVYVDRSQWNKDGFRDRRYLYLYDRIHLNVNGYQVLDSCIAACIARDRKRCLEAKTLE